MCIVFGMFRIFDFGVWVESGNVSLLLYKILNVEYLVELIEVFKVNVIEGRILF